MCNICPKHSTYHKNNIMVFIIRLNNTMNGWKLCNYIFYWILKRCVFFIYTTYKEVGELNINNMLIMLC